MMRSDDISPPAIVAPAEGLGELAAVANAGYEAGEQAARKGIQHYIAAGEALTKAKRLCGHGKWLSWVQKKLRFGDRQASKLMRLYRERDKLKSESDSDLTIDRAACALAHHDNALAAVALPPDARFYEGFPVLQHGFWYEGESCKLDSIEVAYQFAPHPDLPSYWVHSFIVNDEIVYCGRGQKLDAENMAALFRVRETRPSWGFEFQAPPGSKPWATFFDEQDREEAVGRYSYLKSRA